MPGPQEAEPGKGGFGQVEDEARTAFVCPGDASPPPARWGPASREVGTEKGVSGQRDKASVPTAPTVPTQNEKGPRSDVPDAHVSAWLEWAERAAILEYQCGRSRPEAERQATQEALR